MIHRMHAVVALILLLAVASNARADSKADKWAAFRFLIGEWVGEGDGKPGKGSGSFTLLPELDGNVLVRKNRAETPKGVHEDLMVIHPGKDSRHAYATYWDNEGHVIRYAVTLSDDAKTLTFLSEPGQGPRFRLTYGKLGDDEVSVKFEFIPPGRSQVIQTYLEGKARRKPSKSEGK
jgi:hypothetical protein